MSEKAPPIFDLAEYYARLANVKRKMSDAGIEVLLSSNPANMNHLTGYDSWSYYVHQLAVVCLEAPRPLWIGREMDVSGAEATAWIEADDIHAYPTTMSMRVTSTPCSTLPTS